MAYDPSKSLWLNPNIQYLFDEEITEYDMRDAGFSLVKQYKLLPPEKMRELEVMGKGTDRHIAIGKIQRDDKEFSKKLGEKFTEIRTIFVGENLLSDDRIVSVKKDAIFTVGPVKRTRFGGIIFAPKNTYSSYIRFPDIQNLEIYYSTESMDIKGMGDSAVNRHRLYMMEFLKKVIRMIEQKDRAVKRVIMQFVDQYKSRELDEGYYLEFNNMSKDMNPLFNYQHIIIPLVQIIQREVT